MKFHHLSLVIVALLVALLSPVIPTVECEETAEDAWYSDVSLVIHRNGEVDPCGSTGTGSVNKDFLEILSSATDKYQMETRLTDGIATLLKKDVSKCGDSDGSPRNEFDDNYNKDDAYESLYRHCDRGPERTPILLDHQKLVKTATNTLPCRFYTREGLRIQTLEQLKTIVGKAKKAPPLQSCANPQDASENCDDDENDDSLSSSSSPSPLPSPTSSEFHLYAVPAGRVFLFAPAFVGETFHLDHLTLLPDVTKPIILKVLSTSPKIFDILHVFTPEEAGIIVKRSLAETSPSHKIQRSTTGSAGKKDVFKKRTSESGFDTHGKVALALKQRIFEVLGYDEYWNGHDDGLQILRYNMTKAYTPHMDYLPTTTVSPFDYNSDKKGGNRYATILLYMTDIPEHGGGETVFSKIWPEGNQESHEDALEELRESGDAERAGIAEGSWEENMVATCRSRFSVRPHAGRAVLFYSQLPNGEQDPMSLHGGCPVLEGEKWAANLWVWNTPRQDFEGAPQKEGVTAADFQSDKKGRSNPQVRATFSNTGKDESMKDAMLYYDEAMYWGNLGAGDPSLTSNTFEGHRWNVKVDGKIMKRWVIGAEARQEFSI